MTLNVKVITFIPLVCINIRTTFKKNSPKNSYNFCDTFCRTLCGTFHRTLCGILRVTFCRNFHRTLCRTLHGTFHRTFHRTFCDTFHRTFQGTSFAACFEVQVSQHQVLRYILQNILRYKFWGTSFKIEYSYLYNTLSPNDTKCKSHHFYTFSVYQY